MLVSHGDTVVIMDDSVHVISSASYKAFMELQKGYLRCIQEKLVEVDAARQDLKRIYEVMIQLEQLQSQKDRLMHTLTQKTDDELHQLLSEFDMHIKTLTEVNIAIEIARLKLLAIESSIKKIKRRTSGMRVLSSVAAGVGLLAGIILF